jgi:hypothetical protein
MSLKVTNNAFGTLNAGISNSDVTIVLEAGQGARFPVLGAGDYFYATLIDTSNNLEIVKVTARATDTMTVVRAQDGTSARAYNVNDRFELRPTAALFNEKADAEDVTAGLATKQAASPVLTTYVDTGVNFRNRIINGDMRIDQRNAGASVAASGYTLDRWVAFESTSATSVTAQRSTTAPTGFTNSLLYTVGTGGTAAAGEQAMLRQRIEGHNVADFGFGSAAAQAITVSFRVRSSLTGTYSVAVQNSAGDRSYVTTYTVDAANTWETKTVSLPGDTSGTWLTDNGIGIALFFDLGSGSSFTASANAWSAGDFRRVSGQANLIGTSGATFYITGVQLEAGSVATPFERRPYGTELALCQRYFERIGHPFFPGRVNSSLFHRLLCSYKTIKRATPTISSTGAFSISDMFSADKLTDGTAFNAVQHISDVGFYFVFANSQIVSGGFSGNTVIHSLNDFATGVIFVNAEL